MRLRFAPSPPVRRVFFLVPGTTDRYRCGGLAVALHSARLVGTFMPAELVTYRQREQDHLFLDDVLAKESAPGSSLFVVSWGFDVPKLLRRLRGCSLAYHAHSSGYGFDLPPGVPVLAVSRNTLGYWGDRAPRNPLFLVPNALEQQWLDRGERRGSASELINSEPRPIDVLVQKRKSSEYVLEKLVPALRANGLRVEVQSGWVDDLLNVFNSSTVYLYDSAEYWRCAGVSEGFGLPPLEAMACGCVVFSSMNHALADSLTPTECGHQIGCGSLQWDVERIKAAAIKPADWLPDSEVLEALLTQASTEKLQKRWRHVLNQLQKLAAIGAMSPASNLLTSKPLWYMRMQRFIKHSRKICFFIKG